MAIFTVRCPDCGSPTELNDEKEFGFCTECGKRINREDAELYVPEETAEPPALPAEAEINAEAAFAEVAAQPADAEITAGETFPGAPALSAEMEISADETLPDAPAFPAEPETGAETKTNGEHLNALIMRQPQPLDSVVFHSSDECGAYVTELHGLVLDAAARYAQMNHAEEATCLDFLERGIGYCEMLDTKRLRFLAGTHEENGKTVEDYGSFPVSKDVLRDLKQTREQSVEAYNDFFRPKIAAAKATLDETKEKIRQLPGSLRFYHSFCTPLMGILTAALFAIGLVPILMKLPKLDLRVNIPIAVVGGALFIAWVVCTVLWIIKGGSARQLYKAAERQAGEARTYRSKLKS